jgi:hypothetical protein
MLLDEMVVQINLMLDQSDVNRYCKSSLQQVGADPSKFPSILCDIDQNW